MSRLRSRRQRAPLWNVGPRAVLSAALLLVLGTVLAPPVRAQDQASGQELAITSASPEAAHHLMMAWDELDNVNPPSAVAHVQEALSVDADFGLAHVLNGFIGQGMTTQQATAEVDRGMGMLKDASAAEILVALAWREWNAGRTASALAATKAAQELAPGDAHLAFQVVQLSAPGAPAATQVPLLKDLVAAHPDFAPAYNNLAYGSWNAGDHEAALEAVKKYAELRPGHPNPHDSYAEMLQWSGKYDEAAAEYRKAIEADGKFSEAYMGLAELSWLAGKHDEARAHMQEALGAAADGFPKLQARRGIAHSWLMDGKTKDGMAALAQVASDAETAGLKGYAANIHRELATFDGLLNKGEVTDANLTSAGSLGGADTPAQAAWTALAYVSARRSGAGAAVDHLDAMAADNPGLAPVVRVGRAMMMCDSGSYDEALTTLGDDSGDMAKAVSAECMKGLKRGADAKKMKDEVMGDASFSFYDPIHTMAVIRVSKL